MKSLDKKKTSEIFEGAGSSLHQSFVEAAERDKEPKKISACCSAEVATANSGLAGETNYYICTKCHNDCDVIAEPKELGKPKRYVLLKEHRYFRKGAIFEYLEDKEYYLLLSNLDYKVKGSHGSVGLFKKDVEKNTEWFEELQSYLLKPTMKPKELDWEKVAFLFHNTYEGLAPKFGYETRKDTKAFDTKSQNGQLMIATCKAVVSHFLTQQRTELLEEMKKEIIKITDNGYDCVCSSYIEDYFKSLINKKDE